jgi:predicted signal transduction protein with EAL and GGDEF domain
MMKVDALVVEGFVLIGAILYLSGFVWHQQRAIEALQADRLVIGNRLGTIQQQTCFDALTGLRNQQMFEIRVSALLRGTVPFVLIYIDLDGLKAVNERRRASCGRSADSESGESDAVGEASEARSRHAVPSEHRSG